VRLLCLARVTNLYTVKIIVQSSTPTGQFKFAATQNDIGREKRADMARRRSFSSEFRRQQTVTIWATSSGSRKDLLVQKLEATQSSHGCSSSRSIALLIASSAANVGLALMQRQLHRPSRSHRLGLRRYATAYYARC
jgi:hypothetical protein